MASLSTTEVSRDIFGKDFLQHYNAQGGKIGSSRREKDWMGNDCINHYDSSDSKLGSSEFSADWLKKRYDKFFATDASPAQGQTTIIVKPVGSSVQAPDEPVVEDVPSNDRHAAPVKPNRSKTVVVVLLLVVAVGGGGWYLVTQTNFFWARAGSAADSLSVPAVTIKIVTAAKAHFYDRPDASTSRKAYLVKGQKIGAQRVEGGFFYGEVTNASGVTSRGWLRLTDFTDATSTISEPATARNSNFEVTSYNSIKDNKTGIEWYVSDDVDFGWRAAEDWANGLKVGNHDWELPTSGQVMTLYNVGSTAGTGYNNNGTYYPAKIDPVFSKIGHGSWVWTKESAGDNFAYSVNLNQGVIVRSPVSGATYPVRVFAVRSTSKKTVSPVKGKYPQATMRELSSADLNGMTKEELKIMRNEIFARHGYIFKTSDLKSYFESQSWYLAQYDDVTSLLSDIEKKNIVLIKKYE